MKGLTGVLDKFSEGLRVRKILPSLLEEVGCFHIATIPSINPRYSIDEGPPTAT
jgi:hypothetical protein